MDFLIDIIKQTVSLLLSIGVISIIAIFLKEWVKRFVDHHFKLSESQMLHYNNIQLELLKYKVPMSIESLEIIYKIRNYSKNILEKRTPINQEKDLLLECASVFQNKLYSYRALLDRDIFQLLHEFKGANQDFIMYIDISDRSEKLRGGDIYFSNNTMKILTSLYSNIDRLYNDIALYFEKRYKIHN